MTNLGNLKTDDTLKVLFGSVLNLKHRIQFIPERVILDLKSSLRDVINEWSLRMRFDGVWNHGFCSGFTLPIIIFHQVPHQEGHQLPVSHLELCCCHFLQLMSTSFSCCTFISISCYFCCLIVVKYIFHSFSYLCIILSTLRRWGKSAAIQELYSFLGIRTKQISLERGV